MAEKREGAFSSGFLSLQLQLKTLLEGYGGEHALRFMDALGSLAQSEQTVALDVFTSIIDRLAQSNDRFLSEGDLARKDFEDKLYADILTAMRDAAQDASGSRLKVVNGGRTPIQAGTVEKRPLSLCDARKQRKNSTKPLIN